jgi:hypothetical protein
MRRSVVRIAAAIIAAVSLGGCATDVIMVNPHTGATAVCRESLHGLNVWSQKTACVGGYLTQGWVRATED